MTYRVWIQRDSLRSEQIKFASPQAAIASAPTLNLNGVMAYGLEELTDDGDWVEYYDASGMMFDEIVEESVA